MGERNFGNMSIKFMHFEMILQINYCVITNVSNCSKKVAYTGLIIQNNEAAVQSGFGKLCTIISECTTELKAIYSVYSTAVERQRAFCCIGTLSIA